jgi:hypothetical protein
MLVCQWCYSLYTWRLESRSLFSTGKGLRSLLRRVKKACVSVVLLSVYLEAGVKEPVLYREGVALLAKKGEESLCVSGVTLVYLEAGVKEPVLYREGIALLAKKSEESQRFLGCGDRHICQQIFHRQRSAKLHRRELKKDNKRSSQYKNLTKNYGKQLLYTNSTEQSPINNGTGVDRRMH